MSKLVTAPNDINKELSQVNQDMISVIKGSDTEWVVVGSLEELKSFDSTNPAQGNGKWIGIDIDTGLDTIVGATWNGYALTQDDVDEAASVGLGAGHIIFWAEAEALPRTITIGAPEKEDISVTVSFRDR